MTKKLFLSFSATVLLAFTSFAQKADEAKAAKSTYFITGIGGSYASVIDQGISPLLYDGIGGGVVLGHLRETFSRVGQSTLRFDFNNPTSEISGAGMYTYRLEGMYQYFFEIERQQEKMLKVFAGVAGLGRWALREHLNYTNNSQHIETRISLAPAVLLKLPFQLWKRDFELGMFSQLPIVTYATRPLFASSRFSASVNKEEIEFFDYLQDGEIISFGSYFRWSAQTYLLFPFKNGNALRLDYFWTYENYEALNPIKTGEHSLMISTFLKL